MVGRVCSHNGQSGFSVMQQVNSPCELVYLLFPWCRAELLAMGCLYLWLTGMPRNGTAPCVCSLPSSKVAGEDFSARTEPKLVLGSALLSALHCSSQQGSCVAASLLQGLVSDKQIRFQNKNNIVKCKSLPASLFDCAQQTVWLCGNQQALITVSSLGELPRNVDEIRELKGAEFSNGISIDAGAGDSQHAALGLQWLPLPMCFEAEKNVELPFPYQNSASHAPC